MKINKRYIEITFFIVVMFQFYNATASERIYPDIDNGIVMDMQREGIEAARVIAENRIKKAKEEINTLRQKTLRGKIKPAAEGIKKIKHQITIIVATEYSLDNIIKRAVSKVESNEQGYFNRFAEGAQYLGSQIIAPFRSGYGYTQEEKEIALRVIKELVEQQKELIKNYEKEISKKNITFHRRHTLRNHYEEIMDLLDNEIYQQQLITGDAMSIKRKLFWAAVAAGAVVAGAKLLSSPEDVTSSEDLEESKSVETTVSPVIIDHIGLEENQNLENPEATSLENLNVQPKKPSPIFSPSEYLTPKDEYVQLVQRAYNAERALKELVKNGNINSDEARRLQMEIYSLQKEIDEYPFKKLKEAWKQWENL